MSRFPPPVDDVPSSLVKALSREATILVVVHVPVVCEVFLILLAGSSPP